MKKKFFALILSTLVASSFVACGASNDSKLKDGDYTVETSKADDHGYKAKLSIKVSDGKITEAKYNEFNGETNAMKREDKDYNEKMTGVSGIGPAEYEPQLEKVLIEKQSSDIDVITGATSSSNQFKKLAEKILKNAEEGKTEATLVD
ncbi:FMN-binding protein [Clostridium perfringens]|uniref:FMN-binding domain protein n=1 Tax=Clostridium perfringens TaxID=1502 RepID=A0A133N7E6_CLOPF|nr:FMN-binding protein [Clostridium perfringens]EGT3601686.1 FMN-binding protein [Clostridium perfringens]KXA12133.1 FMN-binding domain protein [Clostridium perfringens]MBS5922014.1 FMN-binding protein [Clostridium perfringens]HAT4308542.1 FMN-binding protein [Clostridium perfringens]